MLFMHRLLPLLSTSSDPRIVSVLSAGQEGILNISDLGLLDAKDFGMFPMMKHNVTLMSLAMCELALQNLKVSFIHTNPGMVSTAVHDRWLNGLTGHWAALGWLADARYAANRGTNFFLLDEKAEVLPTHATLKGYEEDGSGPKVSEHTLQVIKTSLTQ
jgi:hypothetical protein